MSSNLNRRPCTAERDHTLITQGSSPICIDTQENFHNYQKTPQDLFRQANRPTNPKAQLETRRPLVNLPFGNQSRVSSSLDLNALANLTHKPEKTTPQTPEESKEKPASAITEGNSKKKSVDKNQPDQLDNDTLFENFDKLFQIKFPSDGPQNQRYSPHKISKTLIFDETDEAAVLMQFANRRLRRDRSRQDLNSNFQNTNKTPQLNLSLRDESELPPLKQITRPIITCQPKNYSLAHPANGAENKENERPRFSHMVKERLKMNPIQPLPKLEKEREAIGFYIHNEFYFANLDPNESYQICDKGAFDSTKSSNDYSSEGWNAFDKMRERLGVFHPSYNRSRNMAVKINGGRRYISNDPERQGNIVDVDIRGNIERRKRRLTQDIGLQALKDNFDNKENLLMRNPRMSQVNKSNKGLRESLNHSIEENGYLRQSFGPAAKESQGGWMNGNVAGGRTALALKDITNFTIKGYQEGVSLGRDMNKSNNTRLQLNTETVDIVPKAANEILQINRPKYQKVNISKMLFNADGTKRSISAPRR